MKKVNVQLDVVLRRKRLVKIEKRIETFERKDRENTGDKSFTWWQSR